MKITEVTYRFKPEVGLEAFVIFFKLKKNWEAHTYNGRLQKVFVTRKGPSVAAAKRFIKKLKP